MAVPAAPTAGEPIAEAWGDVVHDAVVAQDVQAGMTTIAFSASSLSSITAIVFPRPFATAPTVIVSANGGPHYGVQVTGSVSATAFSMQGRRGDGTNQTLTVNVSWLAYGPRA